MKKNDKATRIVIGSIAIARPGLQAAVQAERHAKRRKPTEADRPPPSTFAGRQPRHITGQLDIYENGGGDAV
jgi:hypothetical protein